MSQERPNANDSFLLTPEQISAMPTLARITFRSAKAFGCSDTTAVTTASSVLTAGLWVLSAPQMVGHFVRIVPPLPVLARAIYELVKSAFYSPAAPILDLNDQAPNSQSSDLNRSDVSPSSHALSLVNQAQLGEEEVLESENSAEIKSRNATSASTVISTATRQPEQEFRSPVNGESAHDVGTVKYK